MPIYLQALVVQMITREIGAIKSLLMDNNNMRDLIDILKAIGISFCRCNMYGDNLKLTLWNGFGACAGLSFPSMLFVALST